jgi:WD40 repeat protein
VLTPGRDPLGALAERFTRHAAIDRDDFLARARTEPQALATAARALTARVGRDAATADQRVVLVVDQFEEVFASHVDQAEREAFIRLLVTASQPDDAGAPPVLVLLGIRADFYGHCQRDTLLGQAVTDKRTFDVTPMTQDQLSAAITRPAEAVGVNLEPGLVDRLLRDLSTPGQALAESRGDAAAPDTRLPLLSHALREIWANHDGTWLTLADYEKTGTIWSAVARTAERVWIACDAAEQEIARRLLLHLVYVGPSGTVMARRVVPLADLRQADEPQESDIATAAVLDKLADARLVIIGQDTAELAHEALVHTWPQLVEWIEKDRAALVERRRLTEDADQWEARGRRGGLYDNVKLAGVDATLAGASPQLPERSAAFLAASRRASRARIRRRRAGAATLLALLAAIGTTLGVVANLYSQVSSRNAVIESERIAIEADTLRATDPALSRQFALAAYRRAPNERSAQSLLESATTPTDTELDVGGTVRQVAFSQDDQMLAAAGTADRVRLWTVNSAGLFTAAGTLATGASCVIAFDPTVVRLLVTGCADALTFWNLTDPQRPTRIAAMGIPGPATTTQLAFNAAGTLLATGDGHGSVRLWGVSSGVAAHLVGQSTQSGPVTSLAFSPDGTTLATVTGGTALLWNLRSAAPFATPIAFDTSASAGLESTVAFSPRAHALVVADQGSQLNTWDATNFTRPTLLPGTEPPLSPAADPTDPIEPLAFSFDARVLAATKNIPAAGDTEPVIAVYALKAKDPATVASVTQDTDKVPLPSLGKVFAAVYSHDDRFLATACADGKVRIWPGDVYGSGFFLGSPRGTSPATSDGHYLAVPGIIDRSSGDNYIEIWDIVSARSGCR